MSQFKAVLGMIACALAVSVALTACVGSQDKSQRAMARSMAGDPPQIDEKRSVNKGRNYMPDLAACQDWADTQQTKEGAMTKVGAGMGIGALSGLVSGSGTMAGLGALQGAQSGASDAGILDAGASDRSIVALKSYDDYIRQCLRTKGYRLIEARVQN